jgi:4-amino-4-deoxy-L-arabinose transferase-like glycosyltransferase
MPDQADTASAVTHSEVATRAVAESRRPGLRWLPPIEVLGEPLIRLVVVSCTLLLIAVGLVGLVIHRAPRLSVFDEATHADYAYQISIGHVPAKGSTIAPEILKEWSCHGFYDGTRLPPCAGPAANPGSYPGLGQDYNFAHPPLYYTITGVIARVGDAALPGDSHFITLARLVGSLWLFAAMFVLYLAVRRFGAQWQLAFASAILLALCPPVLIASTTVTNDAPAALSGSLAVLMLARVLVQRKLGWIMPTLVTALSAATKVLNSLPMLSVAGVLLIASLVAWREEDRREARKLALIVLGVLAATAMVYVGWTAVQSGRGLAGWKSPIAGFTDRPVTGNPVGAILSTSFTGFQMISDLLFPSQLTSTWFTLWVRLLAVLAAAAPVLLLAVTRRRQPESRLASAALLGMISYPIIVELQVYTTDGTYFPQVNGRYGMSIIPLLIACLAMTAHRLGVQRSMLTGVGAGALLTVTSVAGLLHRWTRPPPRPRVIISPNDWGFILQVARNAQTTD